MKEYIFTVKGMACGMCESHINDAVRMVADIKSVNSDRRKEQTLVCAETLDTEKIKQVIRDLGYSVSKEVTEREYAKKALFGRIAR